MMTTVYCSHCAARYDVIAGDFPLTCPACAEPAVWTTQPAPTRRWEINENDRRFLRSIRVTAVETD